MYAEYSKLQRAPLNAFRKRRIYLAMIARMKGMREDRYTMLLPRISWDFISCYGDDEAALGSRRGHGKWESRGRWVRRYGGRKMGNRVIQMLHTRYLFSGENPELFSNRSVFRWILKYDSGFL